MKSRSRGALWVVYLVAFEDDAEDSENRIEPFVGMDEIAAVEDAEMTAFLRGGTLLTVLQGEEPAAEMARCSLEAEVLRMR